METRPFRTTDKNRDNGKASGLNVQARSENVALPDVSCRNKLYTPRVRLFLCFMLRLLVDLQVTRNKHTGR